MSQANKVDVGDQKQRTFENAADARRVTLVDGTGTALPVTGTGLVVDTELTLDGDVLIDNLKVSTMTNAIATTAVSVGTSATALPTTALTNRRLITVFNNGNVDLFIGPASVTTVNGLLIPRDSDRTIPIDDTVPLFGIVSAGTVDVRVFEGS